MLVYYMIIVEILYLGKSVQGRWVDMPEFSDDSKVYRIPVSTSDHRHKLMRDYDFFHKQQDNTIYKEQTELKVPLTQYSDINVNRLLLTNLNLEKKKYFTNVSDEHMDEDACEGKHDSYKMNVTFIKSNTKKLETHTLNSQIYNDKQAILEKLLPSPIQYLNATQKEDKNTFFMYLPIEILRSVHKNLRSQPVTTEGKLKFFKLFEKTLSHEIESQLTRFVNPARKKRGSNDHYDHGYDDYEDHSLGFPSIEGALMAISFLTFAVYLVRLVMLLFRNMNTGVQPTVGTVFVGKKKRSMEEFDENTARILHGANNFITNI